MANPNKRAVAEGRYLDPEFVAQVGSLSIQARMVVEGFVTGRHKSPFYGFNIEFAEHREYVPGDEIRYIDWKTYARSDKFHIKLFEEETNMRIYLLVDGSASMGYASEDAVVSKLDYAKCLAASLGLLGLRQKDAVGMAVFRHEFAQYLPPSSRSNHLQEMIRVLETHGPEQTTSIRQCFHQMADAASRRGLVVLISDLWDDPKEVMEGVIHLRHMKFEVMVLHILDAAEIEFDLPGERLYTDMETGEQLAVNPQELREPYRKALQERLRLFRASFREHAIDYEVFTTRDDYAAALTAFLRKRRRVG